MGAPLILGHPWSHRRSIVRSPTRSLDPPWWRYSNPWTTSRRGDLRHISARARAYPERHFGESETGGADLRVRFPHDPLGRVHSFTPNDATDKASRGYVDLANLPRKEL